MPIYADGYSDLFRAITDFELEAGHIYRFSFENNNQWSPSNISSLPQSFFLIDSKESVITSNANLDAYISKDTKEILSIQSYDPTKIDMEIQEKLQLYVDNSIASNSFEFANQYHLIPTPLSISDIGSKQNINLDNGVYTDDSWTNDSTCENQKDLNALEKSHKFFKELQQNTNLRISGWQQTVQNDPNRNLAGGIDKNSIPSEKTGYIWVWSAFNSSGYSEAQQLAKAGYPTVLAYADDTYFDLAYNPDVWEPGFYWATKYADTHAALNSALDLKTTITSLSTKAAKNIKGLEGALWSENINNANHLWYMAFPKMTGLVEASWADQNITVKDKKINWNSLAYRLGSDNTKFLGYIDRIINPNNDKTIISYRGFPNGIPKNYPRNNKYGYAGLSISINFVSRANSCLSSSAIALTPSFSVA